MAVTRTVQETTELLTATYRKEIEKAAGSNGILSKSEQGKLTEFAQRHIDAARRTGQSMTTAKAVTAVKTPIASAARQIAGSDAMIDLSEAKTLRVAELRARAVMLFEAGPSGSDHAALDKAAAEVNVPPINDAGHHFGIDEYRAGTSIKKMIFESTGQELDTDVDLAEWGGNRTGKAAVDYFVSEINRAAKEVEETAEDADEGKALKRRVEKFADAAGDYVAPNGFKQVLGFTHHIEEDGDLEVHILLAQKQDDSWVTVMHTNYPF